MTSIAAGGLSAPRRTVIIRASVMAAALAALCLAAGVAHAQERPPKRDDLDVTMQIIVDPDAKLPDEVVRRIPLPARKPAEPAPQQRRTSDPLDTPAPGKENAREARERGREAADAAKEQREAARRSAAEERRRNRGPPEDRNPREPRPPRR